MSFSSKPIVDPDESTLMGIEPDETVSSQENVALPWFAGVGRLPLQWIGDVYNRFSKEPASSGGKKSGGGGKANWIQFGDVVGFFASGPIDYLYAVIIDREIVWEGIVARDGSNPMYAEVDAGEHGTFRVYWGTDAQTVDTLVLSGAPQDHPPYKNIPYCVGKGVRFGTGKDAPGNIELLVERAPNSNYVPAGIHNSNSYEGSNVLACVSEILLDEFTGLSQGTSLIDDAQWAPVSLDARFSEPYPLVGAPGHTAHFGAVSPKRTKQEKARRTINDLLTYVDGFVRVGNGKLQAGLSKHDGTVEGSLPTLTHHDFVGTPRVGPLARPRFAKAWATYRDRRRHMKKSTVSDDNPVAIEDNGSGESTTIKLEDFQTEHQATRYISEFLQTANQRLKSVSGTVFKDALQDRKEGDQIQVNYAPRSIDLTMRIVRLDDTAHPNKVKVELEQEPGVFQLAYVPVDEERPTATLSEPDELTDTAVFQLPKETTGSTPELWLLAEKKTANAVGFRIHFSDDDATFSLVGEQQSFALKGSLGAALSDVATSLSLDASGLDIDKLRSMGTVEQEGNTLLLMVGDEVMSVGSVTANGGGNYTVGVLRGRLNTDAVAHSSADIAWVIDADSLDGIANDAFPNDGGGRYFKLQPYSYTAGERDLANVSSFSYTFDDIFIAVPTGLAVTAGVRKVTIDIDEPPESGFRHFRIYRNTVDVKPANWVRRTNRSHYDDTEVVVGQIYYYWAEAADWSGNISASTASESATPTTYEAAIEVYRTGTSVHTDYDYSDYDPETVANYVALYADGAAKTYDATPTNDRWRFENLVYTGGDADTSVVAPALGFLNNGNFVPGAQTVAGDAVYRTPFGDDITRTFEVEFKQINNNPVALDDINGTEGAKLGGIADNADVTGDNAAKTLVIPDTRNDNELPSYYRALTRGFYVEFKSRSVIGGGGSGTYVQLFTEVKWSDVSGGRIAQWYTDELGDYYSRLGAANDLSWQSWAKSDAAATAGATWSSDISGQPSDTVLLNENTTKTDVGLGNVDNLNVGTIRAGVTKANVGLSNVDNQSASTIQAGTTKANVGLPNVVDGADVTQTEVENVLSIASGGITLSGSAEIKGNYNPTTKTGYAIFGDGSAEFNNVVIRGDLLAGTIDIADRFKVGSNGAIVIGETGNGQFTFLDGSWNGKISALAPNGDTAGSWLTGLDLGTHAYSDFRVEYLDPSNQSSIQLNGIGVLKIEPSALSGKPLWIERAGVFDFQIDGSTGKLSWAGTGSLDTNLYRSAANQLKTDDSFVVGSNLYIGATDAGFARDAASRIKTLAGDSLLISANAYIGATDAYLSRPSSGIVKITTHLEVPGNITCDNIVTGSLFHSTRDAGYANVRYGSGTITDINFRWNGSSFEVNKNGGAWKTVTIT